ncbi:hypothetical protein [Candidatus Uabimicrobium amorphum]|uniref:Uncharacterized protein n=1 Tax=Uabimicrobium amorphum TaxID=2596890 RepID=A0A5S9IV22_UABAM|nr:hypothetical protein [Candidatus Uabimicrobium amorphum]BBM88287.1 hypothetical protein UABAM_06708 [Candidatus Uabimicrobium amorphum]
MKKVFAVLFLISFCVFADDGQDVEKLKEEVEFLKQAVKALIEKDQKSQKEVQTLKQEIEQLKNRDEQHTKNHQNLQRLQREVEQLKKSKVTKPDPFADEFTNPFVEEEETTLEDPFTDLFTEEDILLEDEVVDDDEEDPDNISESTTLEIEDDFGEEDETEFYLRNSGKDVQGGYLAQQSRRLTDNVLTLSGFFSLEYSDFQTNSSTVESLFPSEGTFNNSHINLYLDARFHESFRFFTELRFLYQPFTEVFELGQVNRSGEVIIERAWAEWEYRDWLKLRGGTFFIPYGIWNLEHGAPILLSTFTPILLRRQIFPERTTGVQANGLIDFDFFDVKYYAWIGNGKVQIEEAALPTQDNQNNKAYGGRVEIQFPYTGVFRELTFGISGYTGKVQGQEFNGADIQNLIAQVFIAEGNQQVIVDLELDGVSAIGEPLDEYRDRAIGFDFRFRFHNFFFQSEFIVNFVKPLKTAVGPVTGLPVKSGSFEEYGGYMQFAYEFDISRYNLVGLLTPFARLGIVQANNDVAKELGSFSEYTFGVNWKVNPAVVLKAEYIIIQFADVKDRDFGAFFSSFNVSF